MSSLLGWLDERPAVESSQSPIVESAYGQKAHQYWRGSYTTSDVRYVISELRDLLVMEAEDGNAASEALSLINAFDEAVQNHERHGANWLSKYGPRLLTQLQLTGLFPWLGTADEELSGDRLADAVGRVFGVSIGRTHTPQNPCRLADGRTDLFTYDLSLGTVEFDRPRDVVIAGRIRQSLVFISPEQEEAWRWHDRIYGGKVDQS
jgi:hypothetical protein